MRGCVTSAGSIGWLRILLPAVGSGEPKVRLEHRSLRQHAVLDQAGRLVKPGGRLAYITCSVLPPENGDQVEGFLSRFPHYSIVPWPELWKAAPLPAAPPQSADGSSKTLLMTPRSFGSDGFFVAVLERK